jgi:hypothetical protein
MNLLFLVTHYRNSGEVRTFVRHLETLLRPGIWIRVYLCDNSGEWDGTENWAGSAGGVMSTGSLALGAARQSHHAHRSAALAPSSSGASGLTVTVTSPGRNLGYLRAILLHPAFFRRGGTLESDSFMYHEELYIGAQCARLGLQVRYEPALKALHYEGTATSRAGCAQIRAWKNLAIRLVLRDFYAEKA